mgnify:CR=1 FL=1
MAAGDAVDDGGDEHRGERDGDEDDCEDGAERQALRRGAAVARAAVPPVVLARAALSLLEGEASPKTAEAATLLRRIAALAEAAPTPSRPDALLPVEATPARRPEPDDAFKTARATPPPPPRSSRARTRRPRAGLPGP